MANPSYLALGIMRGQILYSGQLATTNPTSVYTVPANSAVKITSCSVCNVTGAPVTVAISLLKVGDTADATHRVISNFPLAAGDSLSLTDYLGGAMLGEGESVSVTAGVANAIVMILTGSVSA